MNHQDLRLFLGLKRDEYLKLIKKKISREKFIILVKKGIWMDEKYKIVRFDKYCDKCKYSKKDEKLDPCYECLDYPARLGSEVPEKFEEANAK